MFIQIVNICTYNIRAPTFIKQILKDLKAEINSNTIIVEDFNPPLSTIYRSSRQKINEETADWKNTIGQMESSRIHILLFSSWGLSCDFIMAHKKHFLRSYTIIVTTQDLDFSTGSRFSQRVTTLCCLGIIVILQTRFTTLSNIWLLCFS